MLSDDITLVKLNDDIEKEYLALEVYDFQKDFIETPKGSMEDIKNRSWDISWTIECIFLNDHMIGYAMHGINDKLDVWLDRFMIDKRYQKKSYGTKALSKILLLLKNTYPVQKHILLSVAPSNINAIKLYKRFNFHIFFSMNAANS